MMSYNTLQTQKILPNFLSNGFARYSVFKPISYHIINDVHFYDKGICPICLKVPKSYFRPNSCFHLFCRKCLIQWIKIKKQCPLCRTIFNNIIQI